MGIVLVAFAAAAVVTDPQDMRLGRSVGANGMPVKNTLDMRPSELECARDGHKLVTIQPVGNSTAGNYVKKLVGRDGIEPPTPGFSDPAPSPPSDT